MEIRYGMENSSTKMTEVDFDANEILAGNDRQTDAEIPSAKFIV